MLVFTTVAIGIGAGIALLIWFGQRSLVFHPDTTPVGSADQVVEGGRDLVVGTEDGLELGAWLLPAAPAVDREVAVLYAPGNGGNRENRLGIARELTERGFTVLLMEYRGYGGNPGSPSGEGIARDAAAAAEALIDEGFGPERTLYLGESIGTGVGARLQSTHPPAGVLLRSPFPDFGAVANVHYRPLPAGAVLRDRFPILEHVRDSTVPMTVLYGTDDTIVPPELSVEVAGTVGSLHEEVELEGIGHNDAEMFGAPVADALESLAGHAIG